ncbi:MAG: alpha/beta hydrolase [Acidocella sp. 20-57-95]|nr:MAG: alpha/beta hydrolase [Acidocella sp. 20-57-95]OYV58694.1 MAG: alpha/beta hydrolase [Acidocella sp. 21-58-7]
MATISREDGVTLAYEWLPGASPVVVFLPGFGSDMGGTKAMVLHAFCAVRGQAMLRLDYSGHGASGGAFIDGSIGIWTDDAAKVIAATCGAAPLIMVGSSMGGWIGLLLARQLGARVANLLLIAPAPDFTAELIEPSLGDAQRAALARDGQFAPPSEYGPPMPITAKLLDDGRNHLLLGGPIPVHCPVRILHGMADPDVPWQQSLKLIEKLQSQDVQVVFIKDGDHRLSREADLRLLERSLATLLNENGA